MQTNDEKLNEAQKRIDLSTNHVMQVDLKSDILSLRDILSKQEDGTKRQDLLKNIETYLSEQEEYPKRKKEIVELLSLIDENLTFLHEKISERDIENMSNLKKCIKSAKKETEKYMETDKTLHKPIWHSIMTALKMTGEIEDDVSEKKAVKMLLKKRYDELRSKPGVSQNLKEGNKENLTPDQLSELENLKAAIGAFDYFYENTFVKTGPQNIFCRFTYFLRNSPEMAMYKAVRDNASFDEERKKAHVSQGKPIDSIPTIAQNIAPKAFVVANATAAALGITGFVGKKLSNFITKSLTKVQIIQFKNLDIGRSFTTRNIPISPIKQMTKPFIGPQFQQFLTKHASKWDVVKETVRSATLTLSSAGSKASDFLMKSGWMIHKMSLLMGIGTIIICAAILNKQANQKDKIALKQLGDSIGKQKNTPMK